MRQFEDEHRPIQKPTVSSGAESSTPATVCEPSSPPYEEPRDPRFPEHFDKSENFDLLRNDPYFDTLGMALYEEAYERLNVMVEPMKAEFYGIDECSPRFFVVDMKMNRDWGIWDRIHIELVELIQKHFRGIPGGENPIVRYMDGQGNYRDEDLVSYY